MITPMQPVNEVDWERVDFVRVTLEKPYKGGGLRFRFGTQAAKRNLNYNANDSSSGPVYWPGPPIMFPEEAPAIAGDPKRDSFLMSRQAANDVFGFFHAPLEVPRNGINGLTLSGERVRVAMFWAWFKMPPGDGTMNPPMSRLASPDIPHVAIRPLTKNMAPVLIDDKEVVIRPREFFDFENPTQYEQWDGKSAATNADVAQMLQGFTQDEIDALREIVKARVASAKTKV